MRDDVIKVRAATPREATADWARRAEAHGAFATNARMKIEQHEAAGAQSDLPPEAIKILEEIELAANALTAGLDALRALLGVERSREYSDEEVAEARRLNRLVENGGRE